MNKNEKKTIKPAPVKSPAKSLKAKKLTAEDLKSVVGGFNGAFDHP